MESPCQAMVFLPLVMVLIGQLCCEVIGHYCSVVVLLLLSIHLLFLEDSSLDSEHDYCSGRLISPDDHAKQPF